VTRRLLTGPILLLVALSGLVHASHPAMAQDEPSLSMTLLSQPAWTGQRRPLDLSFEATNTSSVSLDSLTVELLILAPARSRSLFELSIHSDPTPVIAAYPFPQQGTLEPGERRTFRIGQAMDQLVVRGESALYPLRVELRSRDVPVGVLRTPTVFLIERPLVPLNLAWTWVLSEPLQYDPNGVFRPGTIEADVAPGGRLYSVVEALSRVRHRAVDLVVSPTLLDQLERMAGGYKIAAGNGRVRAVARGTGGAAAAEHILALLREVTSRRNVELVAYPMGDPSIPALLRAGMGKDLDRLVEEGRQVVASVLGRSTVDDVARPPGSALDLPTLSKMASLGALTAVVDPGFLTFPKFLSPPTASLVSGSTSLTAVLPDPEVEELIRAWAPDPRLAAQVALGHLASIWFELPGTPGRGAALMFPEKLAAPPPFYPAFVSLIRSSPWLHPQTASAFTTTVPPGVHRQVPAKTYPVFPPPYLDNLERAKTSLAHFSRAIQGADPLIDRLRHNLLLAGSGAFLTDPASGQRFIGSVDRTARRVYDHIGIGTSVVTLTSRAGFIPVTLENGSGYTATVVLQFISDRRLEFSGGDARTVVLPPTDKTLTIGVKSLANGRIPIRVRLVTPGEFFPEVIAERGLVVRSTAYNRVALIVTIGAALFLLAWWGRRFLPRRRT
jgi:Family of unknown function (DUF6049)